MRLSEKQSDFMCMLGRLLVVVEGLQARYGVMVKITELNRTIETQKAYLHSDPPRTTTLKSKHLNGLAIDFAVIVDGKLDYDHCILDEMGMYWECIGGIWGGNWKKFVDRPHFEYNEAKRKEYLAKA